MQEFSIKLEIRDNSTLKHTDELAKEEENYDKLMKDLTNLKDEKQQQLIEFKRRKEDRAYQ